MNIIEMYDKYRKQHVAEFKGLLEEVANEVLHVTEQIPEDVVWENIRTNSDRHSVYCSEETPGKDLNFQYGRTDLGSFPYDDTSVKKLDKFMEEYYPGIVFKRWCELDLYNRKVSFHFELTMTYSDDDFIVSDYSVRLKEGRVNTFESVALLNDDISEILQKEFTGADWEFLKLYDTEDDLLSHVYVAGSVYIDISI